MPEMDQKLQRESSMMFVANGVCSILGFVAFYKVCRIVRFAAVLARFEQNLNHLCFVIKNGDFVNINIELVLPLIVIYLKMKRDVYSFKCSTKDRKFSKILKVLALQLYVSA